MSLTVLLAVTTVVPRLSSIALAGGPLLMVITVAVTYAIAVSLGHVPPFLPMISDLQVFAPECYVSRVFMPLATFLMQVGVVMVCIWLDLDATRRVSPFLRWLDIAVATCTVIALGGFQVVGAVSELKDVTVHEIGALSAFVGLLLYFCAVNLRLFFARRRLPLSRACFALRLVATAGMAMSLVAGVILVSLNGYGNVRTEMAVLEWLCGTAVGAFFVSLSHEVRIDGALHAKSRDDDDDSLQPAINERSRLVV